MENTNNDRQELLDEAKQLGLEFPTNIKTEKLTLMVANAKDCNCNYEHLLMLVILHEIGHFWYHSLGNTYTYTYTNNTNVQEWVAQVFTFLVIKDNLEIKDCMAKLSKHQPYKYQTYTENTPKSVKIFIGQLAVNEDGLKEEVDTRIAALKYNT